MADSIPSHRSWVVSRWVLSTGAEVEREERISAGVARKERGICEGSEVIAHGMGGGGGARAAMTRGSEG
eukprot:6202052-Pleurochrysis_carterae.AAC.2